MERNYVEVLFEEMRSKFDLVLEGHEALHAKIDEYRRESNEKHDLTAFKIDTIVHQLKALDGKIDTVEQSLTTKIDTVERNLTAHIEAVAENLAAHRADTEAHVGYRVRE